MRSVDLPDHCQTPFLRMQCMDTDVLTQTLLKLFDQPAFVQMHDASSVFRTVPTPVSASDEAYISQALLLLGIPPHVLGYKFLRQAILSTLEDESALESMTHRLYPSIALHFGTSVARVERSIRHAIDMAWRKNGADAFLKLCPQGCFLHGEYPTVREFLALVSERVRIWQLRQ